MSDHFNQCLAPLLLIQEEEIDFDIDCLIGGVLNGRESCSQMFLNRDREGAFNILVTRHLQGNDVKFKEYFRISKQQFSHIADLIREDITLKATHRVKYPISAEVKLAVTLRFLATGESFRSLAFQFRISSNTISHFVPQVLLAMKNKLQINHLRTSTAIDWEKNAEEFWERWDFPNCVGAIDGKHVRIVSPHNSGSLFFNFKNFFSTVLFALVDANCKFLLVDVGAYGKEGDAGIFKKSKMGKLFNEGVIFPPPKTLPSAHMKLPHVIVGDEAFRLDEHVMKPYPHKQAVQDRSKRKYNYALSRCRRVTENAFGIMCSIFRIFYTPINLKPETVDLVIFVCCCLHNMLRDDFISHNPQNTKDREQVDWEMPKENMIPLAWVGGFAKSEGFKVRSLFTDYFISPYYINRMAVVFKNKKKKKNNE